jgi:hypothetical protein
MIILKALIVITVQSIYLIIVFKLHYKNFVYKYLNFQDQEEAAVLAPNPILTPIQANQAQNHLEKENIIIKAQHRKVFFNL